ncbi:MAG: hypothetical protein AB7S67_12290 [Thiomonas sp.]
MTHEEHQRKLAETLARAEVVQRDTAAIAERIEIIARHKKGSTPFAIAQHIGKPINRVLDVLGHPLK